MRLRLLVIFAAIAAIAASSGSNKFSEGTGHEAPGPAPGRTPRPRPPTVPQKTLSEWEAEVSDVKTVDALIPLVEELASEIRALNVMPLRIQRLLDGIREHHSELSNHKDESGRASESREELKGERNQVKSFDAEFHIAFNQASLELENFEKDYFLGYLQSGGVMPGLEALVRALGLAVPVPSRVTVQMIANAFVETHLIDPVLEICAVSNDASSQSVLPGICDSEVGEILNVLAFNYDRGTFPSLANREFSGILDSVSEYSGRSSAHASRIRAALVSAITARAQSNDSVF